MALRKQDRPVSLAGVEVSPYNKALLTWAQHNVSGIPDDAVLQLEGCAAGKHADRQVFLRHTRSDGTWRQWQFDRSFDAVMSEIVDIAIEQTRESE
jgi:hypothetical protein